jgi:hypothetical protein
VLIGIVPEDGLQRPHGSRVILGTAQREDCSLALVPVGALQTFARVIPSWLARPQRREQEQNLHGSPPDHAIHDADRSMN